LTSAALTFALLAAAPAASAVKLPANINGFKLAGPPAKYTAETLFEYIDGGAEAFLQFDFQELTAASYVNAKKVEVTADLYRHASPARAFGIYSQERRPGSDKMPGKLEGIASKDHLEFVAGAFYVKLALPGGGDPEILPMLAEKLAASLPGSREVPAVLACFPDKGKRPRSEKLSARDFLGYAFLHDAAAVPYQMDGARFRLFVVEGKDSLDARNMVEGFRVVGKLPAADFGPGGILTIKDPLNGDLLIMWRDRWLWGAVDDASPHRQALVEELGRAVRAGCTLPK
jgi:hypothetical protein